MPPKKSPAAPAAALVPKTKRMRCLSPPPLYPTPLPGTTNHEWFVHTDERIKVIYATGRFDDLASRAPKGIGDGGSSASHAPKTYAHPATNDAVATTKQRHCHHHCQRHR